MAIKDLKIKIIDEANKMLSEEGEENFSVRNLSARLNISHNALYRHFSSKADLLFTLLTIGFEELTEGFRSIFRTDLPEKEQFKECLYLYADFAVRNPNVYKIMQRIQNDAPQAFMEVYTQNYMTVYEVFDRLVKNGTLKNGTAASLLNTTWAFSHGLVLMLIDNILSMDKNLNSMPTQLHSNHLPPEKDIRKVLKFSIDMYFDSMFRLNETGM